MKPRTPGRQAWIERHNPEVCICGVPMTDQEGPVCDDCKAEDEVR